MGYALAAAARESRCTASSLVSGPTELPAPAGIDVIRVTTAAEMRDAVLSRAAQADVVIMAAAVADYAPARSRRSEDPQGLRTRLTLTLVRTPDILAELGRLRAGKDRPVLVGFAAETSDVVASARRKQREKGVDLIVANDVSRTDAGFEVDTNEVTLVTADGEESLAAAVQNGHRRSDHRSHRDASAFRLPPVADRVREAEDGEHARAAGRTS